MDGKNNTVVTGEGAPVNYRTEDASMAPKPTAVRCSSCREIRKVQASIIATVSIIFMNVWYWSCAQQAQTTNPFAISSYIWYRTWVPLTMLTLLMAPFLWIGPIKGYYQRKTETDEKYHTCEKKSS